MERVSFEECQRDRCEAQERILQFDAALAKHEREAALAQQGVLDTAGVVFGQRAEMTAMQALLARAHAREFPAGDHARFCAWLHLNDDCPNISVLRFEHGGGQDFSTESSRALPADVDLLVLVDAAQDAVLHARQREAEAYDEAVADMLRRETEATLSAIQDGYDDTARADVRSTVAAVRAALSPTSQHR
jgi:hypothetical protein